MRTVILGANKRAATALLIVLFGAPFSKGWSQLVVSGQASGGIANGEGNDWQYAFGGGLPTFFWRGDLFVDMVLADDIAFLSNFRLLQDQELRIDLFALRFSDIASTGINVQLGQVDLPIGSLGERRFPKQNPFFRLPLMNEHLTTLCSSDYFVWVLDPEFARRGDGVRILDLGLYDLGVKAYGSFGIFDYALALINGMASATSTYGTTGLNINDGLGTVGRMAVTPVTGLTVGVSYSTGSFMSDQSANINSYLFQEDPDDHPQHIVSGDVEFSHGHFSFYGQAMYNIWEYEQDLKAFGFSAEVDYALTPRLFVAARGGGLMFNEVTNLTVPIITGPVSFSGRWDRDVFRLETSVRYRITREALVKVVYEWNRTFNIVNDPADNLLVLQTVLSF